MTDTPEISPAGYRVARLSQKEIERLATSLSAEERRVLLFEGTEAPFCGTLLDNKKDGTYVCRLCGLPLFASNAKFESGTGWPSFFQPYSKGHVEERVDLRHGMRRVEIRCQRCTGHLGHVFDDGPPPTRLRYCLNSASLAFVEAGEPIPALVESDAAVGGKG